MIFFLIFFAETNIAHIFAARLTYLGSREHSSAGSEHLPYKQRVTGSNPVAPTVRKPHESGAFLFCSFVILYGRSIGTNPVAPAVRKPHESGASLYGDFCIAVRG